VTLWQKLVLGGSLVLAAGTGVFASIALSAGSTGPPAATTTINVAVGATGPQGPAGKDGAVGATGPAGPAGSGGAEQCPAGSTFQAVVLNHPGGQITLWVCVAK
jgi:hypothetical protein